MSKMTSVCLILGAMIASLGVDAAYGQDFTPPDAEGDSPFRVGLFGFASRFGVNVDDGEALMSVTVDVGIFGSTGLRLRPSAEIGFAGSTNTYVVNGELVYRFTPDSERAVPYLGAGVGVLGEDGCGSGCPSPEVQFLFGFDLRIAEHLGWQLEYHAEDAFSRHRIFVGLSTRFGS